MNSLTKRPLSVVILTTAFIVACDDEPSGPSAITVRNDSAVARVQSQMMTLDDHFALIAENQPDFAGLFFEDGEPVVLSTNPLLSVPAIRSAILAVFDDSSSTDWNFD